MRIVGWFGVLLIAAACVRAEGTPFPQTDVLRTAQGDLRITPIRHASLMLEWAGTTIHIDPWSQADYSPFPKADLILITDTHGDHLDLKAIAAITKADTMVVASEAAAKSVATARGLANGASTEVDLKGKKLKIEAVPAYNLTRGPAAGQYYHPKGHGNGYVLTFADKRLYLSGDTECIPEMAAIRDIDVAFLCMNLPYTQTPQEAADCMKRLRPKIVYPYHYRGQDVKVFEEALRGEKDIEVRLRNWY